MRLRGSANTVGTAVAIGLGLLALVVSGSSTAMGVAATVVNLADPSAPAHVARIDTSGRLQVRAPEATVDLQTSLDPFSNWSFIAGPTAATLEVSRIAVANPGSNTQFTGTNWGVTLAQWASSSSNCSASDAYLGTLMTYRLEPGDMVVDNLVAPLQVKAAAPGQKYCLAVQTFPFGSASSWYSGTFSMLAYVTSGSFQAPARPSPPSVAGPTELQSLPAG